MNPNAWDIRALLEGYERKEFKPSEVAAAYLKETEKKNTGLNAVLEVQSEKVLERAQLLEGKPADLTRQPLFGIPIAIKDNILVKGWKATAGSKILANYRAPYTATCVERLEAAGAIIVGKTNCDEFGMGSSNENSAFGPVRNPWDTARVSGGSSGGSAVAVAAGMAAGSLGTDTGGSIRQPASLCGVVGLKPSYGRVSRYGVIAYSSSLDQVGPFGRSVWDCARILEAMGGYDSKDATSSRSGIPAVSEKLKTSSANSLKSVTAGYSKAWLEGADAEVRAAFDRSLEVLASAGTKLVEIELPHVKYSLSTYYLIAPAEASSNLARYDGIHYGHRTKHADSLESVYSRSRGEGFGREVKQRIMLGTYALSSGYYDAYYGKAGQVRSLIQKDFEEVFRKCQVVLSPASPTTAFKIGEKASDPMQMYLSDIYTLPVNLAGLPGLSVPCGQDAEGLPIGLQMIGRSFDEVGLLEAAFHFERLRGSFPNPPAGNGGGR